MSARSVRSASTSHAGCPAQPTALAVLAMAGFAALSATPARAHSQYVHMAPTERSTVAVAPTEVEPVSDAAAAVSSGTRGLVGAVAPALAPLAAAVLMRARAARWRRGRRIRCRPTPGHAALPRAPLTLTCRGRCPVSGWSASSWPPA
jgi:hypothetical protein